MDIVDSKIISFLQKKGKVTLKEIAEALNYTTMGIKKRLDKLMKRKDVSFYVNVNVKNTNALLALIIMEIQDLETMIKIYESIKECPRNIYTFSTFGGTEALALILGEDKNVLNSVLSGKCSLRCRLGVRRSEVYLISDVQSYPYLPIKIYLATMDKEKAPCDADCLSCICYEENNCPGCPATKHYRRKFFP